MDQLDPFEGRPASQLIATRCRAQGKSDHPSQHAGLGRRARLSWSYQRDALPCDAASPKAAQPEARPLSCGDASRGFDVEIGSARAGAQPASNHTKIMFPDFTITAWRRTRSPRQVGFGNRGADDVTMRA